MLHTNIVGCGHVSILDGRLILDIMWHWCPLIMSRIWLSVTFTAEILVLNTEKMLGIIILATFHTYTGWMIIHLCFLLSYLKASKRLAGSGTLWFVVIWHFKFLKHIFVISILLHFSFLYSLLSKIFNTRRGVMKYMFVSNW